MRWIAPTEKDNANHALEKRLWDAADQFRANSGLKAGEYSGPVLGLIFLRFAEARFAAPRAKLEKAGTSSAGEARASTTRRLPCRGRALPHAERPLRPPAAAARRPPMSGKAVNDAMARHREAQSAARGRAAAQTYNIFTSTLLKELLKKVSEIPVSLDYDAFGRIYEYFLGEFARTEGQKGGEFYTPSSHRPPADRNHRALPRPHPRPRLRLRRHVRPVARASWPSTRRTPPPNSPSTASKRPTRPAACAA